MSASRNEPVVPKGRRLETKVVQFAAEQFVSELHS